MKLIKKEKEIPTSIKIGKLSDKKSLKSKLMKKAIQNKESSLHSHIVNTLLNFGV